MTDQLGVDPEVPLLTNSLRVKRTRDYIQVHFPYHYNEVTRLEKSVMVTPKQEDLLFRTQTKVPKHGVLCVGLNGNNGTTLVAGLLANKWGEDCKWFTRRGLQTPNFYGSVTQCTTVKVGVDTEGQMVHVPFSTLVPLVKPEDLVVGGWDINGETMGKAMERAEVLHYNLQEEVEVEMRNITPMPSVYDPSFIAANMKKYANNILPKWTKMQYLDRLREDIRGFKEKHKLDSVTVLWTASTERYVEYEEKLHGTDQALLEAIANNEKEISPSILFAVAAVLEKCTFVNGSPQNTLVPGVIQLAEDRGVFVAGNDLKTGQTKVKSVLMDFLVSAGLKPVCITSYNHLGNRDGENLESYAQFRSKEKSKSDVIKDMCAANQILYPDGELPNHTVVIKYQPYVKDSKRAQDEYISQLSLGGENTLGIFNTCEDSLLAWPLILDLILLSEFFSRVSYRRTTDKQFKPLYSVLSLLSVFLKQPMVKAETPCINAFFKQLQSLTNFITCCCLGLAPDTELMLHQVLQ